MPVNIDNLTSSELLFNRKVKHLIPDGRQEVKINKNKYYKGLIDQQMKQNSYYDKGSKNL